MEQFGRARRRNSSLCTFISDMSETSFLAATDTNQCLCFSSVMNLDDLTRRGLYLSDIPLHDATRDLVLLGEQFREEYKLTQELEILTDRLQHTLRALEDEKKKTDRWDRFSAAATRLEKLYPHIKGIVWVFYPLKSVNFNIF